MDYLELPSMPKGVLEKLMAISPESYKPTGPVRPLAGPLFNSARSSSPAPSKGASRPPLPTVSPAVPNSGGEPASPGLPRRDLTLPFPPFPAPLESIAKNIPQVSGSEPLLKLGKGSASPGEETLGNGKQKRVRKSRASGTPRKKGKADSAVETSAAAPAEGQVVEAGPSKSSRVRSKATANSDNMEKPPRRRNRQAAKGKTKEAQVVTASSNDRAFMTAPNHGPSEPNAKGILGIYGLDTKVMNVTRYMKEIPLEGLMSGDFKFASPVCKQDLPSYNVADNTFGKYVTSILQILAKPAYVVLSQPRRGFGSGHQMDCKTQKTILDLESTPQTDDAEGSCSLSDKTNKDYTHVQDGSDASAPGNGKALEGPPLFPVETLPLFPVKEFWSRLQLQPTESLESLLAQATISVESRAAPSQTGARVGIHKSDGLPPTHFPLNSAQALHENVFERYPRLNRWSRAQSPKDDFPETPDTHLACESPDKRRENDAGRLGQKDGLMDIDLNKQSPEAEAADTFNNSAMLCLKPEAAHCTGHLPPIAASDQSRLETGDHGKPQPACLNELGDDKVNAIQQAVSTCNDVNNVTNSSDAASSAQKNVVGELLIPGSEYDSGNIGSRQCEPQKDLPADTSSHLPLMSTESPEFWNDVPRSPGVQAAAQLLCKMANSSTPFYIDRDEGGTRRVRSFPSSHDTPTQGHPKISKIGISNETPVRKKNSGSYHESQEGGFSLKMHVGEGRNKLLSQVGSGYASAVEEISALAQSRGRCSTLSRSVPKSIASNQSSDSDKSPDYSRKVHSRSVHKEDHGNVNKMENLQGPTVATRKLSNPVIREGRKSQTNISKVHSLCRNSAQGTSFLAQKKSTAACETEQVVYAEGLSKTSRPRSSSARNCLPLHRNVNAYPVKPGNINGCPVKPARQILPLVGEVRHGTK